MGLEEIAECFEGAGKDGGVIVFCRCGGKVEEGADEGGEVGSDDFASECGVGGGEVREGAGERADKDRERCGGFGALGNVSEELESRGEGGDGRTERRGTRSFTQVLPHAASAS